MPGDYIKGMGAKSKKGIGHNIKTAEKHGKPHDQAVAIALNYAGKSKKEDVEQGKHEDKLDHHAIMFYANRGGDVDGIASQLQLSAAKGDSEYVKHLQKLLDAKNIMDLANKILNYSRKFKGKKEDVDMDGIHNMPDPTEVILILDKDKVSRADIPGMVQMINEKMPEHVKAMDASDAEGAQETMLPGEENLAIMIHAYSDEEMMDIMNLIGKDKIVDTDPDIKALDPLRGMQESKNQKWTIVDWAGNYAFDKMGYQGSGHLHGPKNQFDSFDDAYEFLVQKVEELHPETKDDEKKFEEEMGEYEVVPYTGHREKRFLDPKDPRAGIKNEAKEEEHDDEYYIQLAMDHKGSAIRDNSREEKIMIGKNIEAGLDEAKKNKLSNIQKELKKSLSDKGMIATFGDGYINIANPHGVHCEFYGDLSGDSGFLTASYAVPPSKKNKDLDFSIPEESDLFVDTVEKILKSDDGSEWFEAKDSLDEAKKKKLSPEEFKKGMEKLSHETDLSFDGGDDNRLFYDQEMINVFANIMSEEQYDKMEEEINDTHIKGKGYEVYAWNDVSGYKYWKSQGEADDANYIMITAAVSDPSIVDDNKLLSDMKKAFYKLSHWDNIDKFYAHKEDMKHAKANESKDPFADQSLEPSPHDKESDKKYKELKKKKLAGDPELKGKSDLDLAKMAGMKSIHEAKGSGFGKYKKGKEILDIHELKVGKEYLIHSDQFDADNVIQITALKKAAPTAEATSFIAYAHFVNPENFKEKRMHDDKEFAIWDHDLGAGEHVYELGEIMKEDTDKEIEVSYDAMEKRLKEMKASGQEETEEYKELILAMNKYQDAQGILNHMSEDLSEARKKEVSIYSFDELNPKVQDKVLERFRYINHVPEFITENFEDELKEWGLIDPKVYWSLSYSQGDGVAFEGRVDLDKFLKGTKFEGNDNISRIEIVHEGRDFYYNSMHVDIDSSDGLSEEDSKELKDLCKEKIRAMSKKLEKSGYEEIEYMTSDEAVKETLDANDYEFYSNGDMAVHESVGKTVEESLSVEINGVKYGYVDESGEKFKALTSKLAAKGAKNPKALAAWIGRKKLGKAKFQAKAAAGKKHEGRKLAGEIISEGFEQVGKPKLVAMAKKIEQELHEKMADLNIGFPGLDVPLVIKGYDSAQDKIEDGEKISYPEMLHFNIESWNTHKLSLLNDGEIIPEGEDLSAKGISKDDLINEIIEEVKEWAEYVKEKEAQRAAHPEIEESKKKASDEEILGSIGFSGSGKKFVRKGDGWTHTAIKLDKSDYPWSLHVDTDMGGTEDKPYRYKDSDDVVTASKRIEKHYKNDKKKVVESDEGSEEDQEPAEEDIVLSDSGHLGSKVSASVVGGKFLGEFDDMDQAEDAIRAYMKKSNFYPTVWYMSDHGNLSIHKM